MPSTRSLRLAVQLGAILIIASGLSVTVSRQQLQENITAYQSCQPIMKSKCEMSLFKLIDSMLDMLTLCDCALPPLAKYGSR